MVMPDRNNTVIMITVVISSEQQPWHLKTSDSDPVITSTSCSCRLSKTHTFANLPKPFTTALISACHDQHVPDMCCLFQTDEQYCRLEVRSVLWNPWKVTIQWIKAFPTDRAEYISPSLKSIKSTTATLMPGENTSGFNGRIVSFKKHAGKSLTVYSIL